MRFLKLFNNSLARVGGCIIWKYSHLSPNDPTHPTLGWVLLRESYSRTKPGYIYSIILWISLVTNQFESADAFQVKPFFPFFFNFDVLIQGSLLVVFFFGFLLLLPFGRRVAAVISVFIPVRALFPILTPAKSSLKLSRQRVWNGRRQIPDSSSCPCFSTLSWLFLVLQALKE